ncbi:hypothetical protein QEH59_06950 [Coraliomargarita sp. SDUM461004]|uniref:Alpha/beta hydrolase n=1 Tax=Thalassobacterium sedimentorum TaxID=3041258 RepID=A0ABU1AJY8_9BACT|nr:hypothetical protein [Coraliomargarita sp. SDUM461004]MDQ8194155.1 hypothetical protein [Coraliomargarita sp. SDUM461004]
MIDERFVSLGAELSDWRGYRCWNFEFEGLQMRVVLPRDPARGRPWFWRPEFFNQFAETDELLIECGWVMVFLDLPDHYGCPVAVDIFTRMYDFVTAFLGLAERMAIVALSRAGLSAYNFSSVNSSKVCAIYADNPVCDFRSWPGGAGAGVGSPEDWNKLIDRYQMSDSVARCFERQPLSRAVLEPIVAAGIPVLHVCGDADEIVPYEENSARLGRRFSALGGRYEEIVVAGRGHHPHGLKDPSPVVEFFTRAFAD